MTTKADLYERMAQDAEVIGLASKLTPDEIRTALQGLDENDRAAWRAKAAERLRAAIDARPPQPPAIDIRLVVEAPPGLSHDEVANYIRTAVENYSGCLHGDDPCRSIHVERVQRLGWVDAKEG